MDKPTDDRRVDPRVDHHEARLTELEIKASYSEDLLDRLNEVVVRQQAQIDALQRAFARLQAQALEAPEAALRSLRDELPPHY